MIQTPPSAKQERALVALMGVKSLDQAADRRESASEYSRSGFSRMPSRRRSRSSGVYESASSLPPESRERRRRQREG